MLYVYNQDLLEMIDHFMVQWSSQMGMRREMDVILHVQFLELLFLLLLFFKVDLCLCFFVHTSTMDTIINDQVLTCFHYMARLGCP